MDFLTVGIGVLILLYAFYIFYLRLKNDTSKLTKLTKMKEMWGEKKGSIIHFIGYVFIPMISGVVFVLLGFLGVSLF